MLALLEASWGDAGKIVFEPGVGSALQQMSEAGGAPAASLTRLENGEIAHVWPEFLPGGKAVLFGASGAVGSQIVAWTIGTGDRRTLIQVGTQPRYARSGHLLYAQGGNLIAVPFDPQRLTVVGAAVPVVEGVVQSVNTGSAQYGVSMTGSLVYLPGGLALAQSRLVWVDRKGQEQALPAPTRSYLCPGLSPDGQRVAVTVQESEAYNIWVDDLAHDRLDRRTFQGSANFKTAWTPDGKRVAFASNDDGPYNLFWQWADGSGGPERLASSEYFQNPVSWSPDGQLLAFIELNPTTGSDIWVLANQRPQGAASSLRTV